jgi:hypothetical protein
VPPAGSEVIRSTADGNFDAAGVLGMQEFGSHFGAEPALGRMRVVGSVFGQWASCRSTVHVDVLHADQPGACGFRGGKHCGLQCGELCAPLVIGRVHRLVNDGGTLGGADGEDGVGGVSGDGFHAFGHVGLPGPIHEPDGAAPPTEGIEGGQPDGAGAEDDVEVGIHG